LNTFIDSFKHKGQRQHLIDVLKQKGISNQEVLSAISILPRHLFLPIEFESHAYEDKAFPIAENQTISQPYTVAYQTQLLNLKDGDKVLEIGTGSGYQGSVLFLCGAEVHSIERHKSLSITAAETLKMLKNVHQINIDIKLYVGDGSKGLQKVAPFNKIIVTAGAPSVPKALVNQLEVGGILVIPVGKESEVQRMVRITKQEDSSLKQEVFDQFSFVPLVGENAWNL
jgi:protein-L-isoaspartate(D-aspartate) O-methyltransferase